MKKVSLLLVLIASFAFLFSCQKMEGDDIPSIDGVITGYSLDSTGVLKLTTTSNFKMTIDMLKLYYVEDALQPQAFRAKADSIILRNIVVPKEGGIADTIWALKPNTVYKYYAVFQDFTPLVDTIADSLKVWKQVKMMNPSLPERVTADTAWMFKDTLWLLGSVCSHWRPLTDSLGLTRDLKFLWGTTVESLDHEMFAQKVKDTLKEAKLEVSFQGFIPKNKLQGADKVWFKAYAKHAWGDGEKYSALDSISLSTK